MQRYFGIVILVDDPKKDIVDGPFGSNLKAKEYIDTGVPVLKIQNIKENQFIDKNINYISEEKAKELSRHSFKSGDLIITKLGDPLGLCCKVPDKYPYGVIVADLIRFRPNSKKVVDKYLIYAINSIVIQDQFRAITKGTTRPRVNLTIVRSITLAFAPLPEQRAIVSKIEQLFSDLDNGIENFKKAQKQLKRYRQSVLKNACEGKLVQTEAELARAEGCDYEPADVLLVRILKERREKWNGKGKYKEPVAPDTTELPELPEGWIWTKMDVVCNKIQDGTHFSPKKQFNKPANGRYPYITAKNIKENGLNLTNITYVDESFHQTIYERCNPEKGDVLLIKDGVTTGTATINTLNGEFSLLSSVALLKTNKDALYSYYLKYFLNSPTGFKIITGKMTGTAIKRIILAKIKNSNIPFPPLVEQHRIAVEVEHRLLLCEKMEEKITESLKKAESLRQSILKKAFEGKLLNETELEEARNAPDWEPAEKLLERIKAEKKNIKTKNKDKK